METLVELLPRIPEEVVHVREGAEGSSGTLSSEGVSTLPTIYPSV